MTDFNIGAHESELIKHPSHYTAGRKYEPKDVIRDWELNFNLGSVVKYISRAGRKGDKIEDLEKARQFLDFEIEALKEERVEKITHSDFQAQPVEFPSGTPNIDQMSVVDFERQAEVNFLNAPLSVQNACEILREELQKHEDLYCGFLASIYSALRDTPDGTWIDEMPEIILSRLIGE